MAAAPDDAPVSQMESYLTCSICLETLQDPRTLPCFHSFCKCCLEKFVKGQRQRKKAEGIVIEEFHCPECRTEFEVKEGKQVADIKRNHFICNMIEVLAIQRRSNQVPCNSCERKLPVPAVSRCVDCKHYLCRECLGVHGNWPPFKKHTVFTMEELVKPENQDKTREKSACEKHENETLEYYCETCEKLACRHCVLLEHNEGHSFLSTEEVAKKKRKLLKSSSSFLNEQLKEGSDALKHIEHVLQELKKNAEKAKDQISQETKYILEEFTKRQKAALKAFVEKQKSDLTVFAEKLEEKAKLNTNAVDNSYNDTHWLLGKQKADMHVYVEKVKISTELSNNLLEKGTREEIILDQKQIEENVKKVKNEQQQMKPVHDGNIQYKADPANNIDTISKLNKMGKVVVSLPTVAGRHNLRHTSTILTGHIEYVIQVVCKWLGYKFQWHLCYRASTHGWSAQNFHRKCDSKGPTVTLVKVGDYTFGGYTDQNWAGRGYKLSNESFLFSLKNKDNVSPFKAPVYQNPQDAIYSNPSCGPSFGGYDLCISNDSHTNQRSYTNFGHTYQPPAEYNYNTQQTQSLLAGSHYFTPTEIEVFY